MPSLAELVSAEDLREGDTIHFTGSKWTITQIKDRNVYGIGGRLFFGHIATVPCELFRVPHTDRKPLWITRYKPAAK